MTQITREAVEAALNELLLQYKESPEWDEPKDVIEGLEVEWLLTAALPHLRPTPSQGTREDIARWMISNSLATGHGDTVEDLLDEAKWQIAAVVRAEEREACAKVAAEADNTEVMLSGGAYIAAAIRGRKS